jgi:hypothetical protein
MLYLFSTLCHVRIQPINQDEALPQEPDHAGTSPWTSSLKNCKKLMFYSLSYPYYGNLL